MQYIALSANKYLSSLLKAVVFSPYKYCNAAISKAIFVLAFKYAFAEVSRYRVVLLLYDITALGDRSSDVGKYGAGAPVVLPAL